MSFIIIATSVTLLVFLCHMQKSSKIFPTLLFLIGILIVACCNEGNDFKALQFRYDYWYFIEEFPVGFQWILNAAKSIGLSFTGFKFAFALFAYCCLFTFYRKYSIWPAICCALVFIFPCDSFYGQIRNGISAIIVVFAIMYYLTNEGIRTTIVFITLIFVATIIHPSSLIYVAAVLVHKNIKSKNIIGFTIVSFIVLTLAFYGGFVSRLASVFIHDPRVLRWLQVGMFGNMFGSLASAMGHILGILYLGYVRRKAYIDGIDEEYSDKLLSNTVIDRIYNFNLLSMALIPLYFVTHAYFRLFKYLLLIDVLVAVQAAYSTRRNKETIFIMSVLLFFGFYFVSSMVGVGYREIPTFFNSFDWSSLTRLMQ